MSNKPLKLREKGLTLQPLPASKPSRASPLTRVSILWKTKKVRFIAAQTGLALCLAVLSLAYIVGLGDSATAVIAKKRELPVYNVEHNDKVLSISFDASWGADKTIPILDMLDKDHIKTTFFLVGNWVDRYPDLVKEIFARGHEIGNHSNTHAHMSQLDEKGIQNELCMMSDKVEKLTGVRPTLFRPPYGDYNDRVVQVARANGYEVIQWSVDSLDWKDRGTTDIIKQCTNRVNNGDIVLFHNDSNDILNALPTVIKHYLGLEYKIIPIGEILLKGKTTIDVQGKQHPITSAESKK